MSITTIVQKLHIQADIFKDIDNSTVTFGFAKFMILVRVPSEFTDITLFDTFDFQIKAYSVHYNDKSKLVHDSLAPIPLAKLLKSLDDNKALWGYMLYYNTSGEVVAGRKVSSFTDNNHNNKLALLYSELCELAEKAGLPIIQPQKVGPMKTMIYDIVEGLTDTAWADVKILIDDYIVQIPKRFVPYMLMSKFGINLLNIYSDWQTKRTDSAEKMFWLRLLHVDQKLFEIVDKNKYELPTGLYHMKDYISVVESVQRKK